MTSDLQALLERLGDEVDGENDAKRTPEEARLHGIAQKLLVLERDLKAPGATRSSDERVDRILEAISKEKF